MIRGGAIHSTHGAIVSLAELSDLGPYSVESRLEVFEAYVEKNFPKESNIQEGVLTESHVIPSDTVKSVPNEKNKKYFLWLLLPVALLIGYLLRLQRCSKPSS